MKLLSNPSIKPVVEDHLQCLTLREVLVVFEYIEHYFRQFLSSVGLPTPYFTILDNTVVQDLRLEDPEPIRKLRARAIKSLFYYLKAKLPSFVYLAVTPVTLYEFIGKRQLKDERDFETNLNEISSLFSN